MKNVFFYLWSYYTNSANLNAMFLLKCRQGVYVIIGLILSGSELHHKIVISVRKEQVLVRYKARLTSEIRCDVA